MFICVHLWLNCVSAFAADPPSFPVSIQIDCSQTRGPLKPIWRFFGYDEANYTYMKDGQKLLAELGQLSTPQNQVFIRCHHLLTTGDGSPALKWGSTNAYTEDGQGHPIYSWAITDRIFDTYVERGLKPYVQIGFMPEALSTHPQDYPHNPPADERAPVNAGQAYPPKDFNKWAELVFQWTKHCVEKYGQHEVGQWHWEVWNEPNIAYWQGSHEDYFKLYDYSVDAVRRALPTARVGGPETAGGPGGKFLAEFLTHCDRGTNEATGKTGSPLDFISFHAKGKPEFLDNHVRMGMSNQLNDMDNAFAVIASFPQYKTTPIVIGESDPEGCAACRSPQTGYRNGTMYSSYTAANFPRAMELAEKHGVNLQGALTWAFEFENQPPFAGFRALASDGIDLPVLNVFRLFAKMSGKRLAVQTSAAPTAREILTHGVRQSPDVSALAAMDEHQLAVLLWHYHDDDVPGPDASITLTLTHLPAKSAALTRFRVDHDHGNAYTAWQAMGSPEHLSADQRTALESAGQLAELEKARVISVNGGAALPVVLPRQGVSLVLLRWGS